MHCDFKDFLHWCLFLCCFCIAAFALLLLLLDTEWAAYNGHPLGRTGLLECPCCKTSWILSTFASPNFINGWKGNITKIMQNFQMQWENRIHVPSHKTVTAELWIVERYLVNPPVSVICFTMSGLSVLVAQHWLSNRAAIKIGQSSVTVSPQVILPCVSFTNNSGSICSLISVQATQNWAHLSIGRVKWWREWIYLSEMIYIGTGHICHVWIRVGCHPVSH